jgi:hypothetical protein
MEELILELFEEEMMFPEVETLSWWQRFWWTGETEL